MLHLSLVLNFIPPQSHQEYKTDKKVILSEMIGQLDLSKLYKFHNISWFHISWDIKPEPNYLMVADFVKYYTSIPISHSCRFYEILHQNPNISCFRLHEILHQTHNISSLQISWYIITKPQYLMVEDFVICYTRTIISHGCRFYEILHHIYNISCLQILWDITLVHNISCFIFH